MYSTVIVLLGVYNIPQLLPGKCIPILWGILLTLYGRSSTIVDAMAGQASTIVDAIAGRASTIVIITLWDLAPWESSCKMPRPPQLIYKKIWPDLKG